MKAAGALEAIRHRHLYDVNLGRWDEDEVGMLGALDAVLELLNRQRILHVNLIGEHVPCLIEVDRVEAAISDALGGVA